MLGGSLIKVDDRQLFVGMKKARNECYRLRSVWTKNLM